MAIRKRDSSATYTGELATPIYEADVSQPGILSDAETSRKAQIINLLSHKLQLLFELYQIRTDAKDSWMQLAIKLAFVHVPGMAVVEKPSKPGNKAKWSRQGEELITAVDAIKRSRNLTADKDALETLKQEHPKVWTSAVSSLQTRLGKARSRRKMRLDFSLTALVDQLRTAELQKGDPAD